MVADPSKLLLNDLEHQFDVEMIGQVRALGVKVRIATTDKWGSNPLSFLPALTAGGVMAIYSYGEKGQLEKNPLVADTRVHWLAVGQVVGVQVTMSEWNAAQFPSPDRHTLPVFVVGCPHSIRKSLKLTKRNVDQTVESIPVVYRGGRCLEPLGPAQGSNWFFAALALR